MNLKIGVFALVAGLVGAVLFSQSQRPATMPELNGAVGWLNSGPLTAKSLRGEIQRRGTGRYWRAHAGVFV